MVLASLVHYSARLKCGIDMVGISNFVTFLENTADYRRDLRRLKYGIPFTLLSLTVHSITHSIVFLVANTLYVELYSFHQRSPLPLPLSVSQFHPDNMLLRRTHALARAGDERQPDMRAFLTGISPLTNVAKIQRPLFIIQGANDPRVPLSEAEQIHQGVQANGQEAWYMVAADEGHGFAKKANVDQYQTALVAFVEKFLLS